MLALLWILAIQQRGSAGVQGLELLGFAALTAIIPVLMFFVVLARVRHVDRAQREHSDTGAHD